MRITLDNKDRDWIDINNDVIRSLSRDKFITKYKSQVSEEELGRVWDTMNPVKEKVKGKKSEVELGGDEGEGVK